VTGGSSATGGGTFATGGAATGGAATGGAATGGNAPTGGANATGGATSTSSVTGPCDIYAAASPATPCVAAYSTTRVLRGAYTGPLYQVRKGGSASGSGGTTQDIGTIAGGFADGAAQDAFCGTSTCTFSIIYDQSGRGNDLKVAPAGCYTGTASEPDYESSANHSLTISGHKVYSLYMIAHDGYRNNSASGMPTGSASQGIYEVADGTRVGTACCWDFGNASVNNCNQGTMDALYFGTGYWGSGSGNGPWFMADLEGGVWAGGTGASNVKNNNLPSSNVPYAFGILKTTSSNYEIRVGNAQSGTLTTANNTGLPKTLNSPGGIILGIGGDNSNSSLGTFFEGAITSGQPSDSTDAAVLANVQAARYGQ
jgi:non-reducing end alpha-L-arabinofuranosidase